MRNLVVTALAAMCISGAIATPAAAEEVTVTVTHTDLDLTTSAGKKALETRVAAAIKVACVKPETRDLKTMQAWESCKSSAKSGAEEQLAKSFELASI
ncbi:UrcA family protein [Altererythrobacter fulvus]|uniref:UrcA family protein n=1 Tax=Caenibius fulvus TaxID=2126012 RepID=UPI00301882B3